MYLDISEEDKELYQKFSNLLYHSLSYFSSEPKFVSDPNVLIEKLKKALRINAFENVIQRNEDVISCIVACAYSYSNGVDIPRELVRNFLDWFANSTTASQDLILANLAAKLSIIEYRAPEPELPF